MMIIEGNEQTHKGFSGRRRLASEVTIAAIACYAMMNSGRRTRLPWPCRRSMVLSLTSAFLSCFGAFVIVSAGNAVISRMASTACDRARDDRGGDFRDNRYLAGNAIFSTYLGINFVPGSGELAVVCGALIGAGLGFFGSTRRPRRSSWAIRIARAWRGAWHHRCRRQT